MATVPGDPMDPGYDPYGGIPKDFRPTQADLLMAAHQVLSERTRLAMDISGFRPSGNVEDVSVSGLFDPVTRKLSKAGCRTFFVADVAEGRRVRAIAPDATIYVLNGLMPGSAQAFANDNLRPVINSTTELAEWDAFVATKKWNGGAALHVDTGMNRLGISIDEAIAIATRIQSENHGFALVRRETVQRFGHGQAELDRKNLAEWSII